jgi:hypothetical protein
MTHNFIFVLKVQMEPKVWSKVQIEPLTPPLNIKYLCESRSFFIRHKKDSYPVKKAFKVIKEISKDLLLSSYEGNLSVVDGTFRLETSELKFFLASEGYETNIEDLSVDQILETALTKYFEHIYVITSIKPASNCEACRLKEGGQASHMEEGGCLYREKSL